MALNICTIMGRLTAAPEIKQAGEHKYTAFSVAVDRSYVDEDGDRQADFIRCVAWNGTAEFISKYFPKGAMIALSGRLQTGSYEDDKGSTHYTTDLVVQQVSFTGEAKKDQPQQSGGKKSGKKKTSYPQGYPF